MRLEDLRGLFSTSNELRNRILEFVQQQSIALEQSGLQQTARGEERLARWLLLSRDRTGTDTMTKRQEFMADMLGTHRTTVTLVATSLQQRGLISYRRGKVTIVSRADLEKDACGCLQGM